MKKGVVFLRKVCYNTNVLMRVGKPVNGEKKLIGILKSFEEPFAEIEIDGNCEKIDMKDISAAKLVYHF